MKTGRPRTFDEDETLTKVMNSFWEHGFEGTTFEQLVEDSGLSRSSLYNSFGGKDALFERALTLYTEKRFSRIRDGLESEETGAQKLQKFVEGGIRSRYNPDSKDCLLRKTVLRNVGSTEPPKEVKRISGYLSVLWNALTTAINGLNRNKAIQLSTQERSALIVAAFFGSAAISRNGGDKALLKAVADGAAKLAE